MTFPSFSPARIPPAAPSSLPSNRVTAAQQSALEGAFAFANNLPRGSVYLGATATIGTASTWTPVSFDTVLVDTDGFWVSGHPTRLVFPIAGAYDIDYGFATSGGRGVNIRKNAAGSQSGGTSLLADSSPGNAVVPVGTALIEYNGTFSVDFAANDYVELFFYGAQVPITPSFPGSIYLKATMVATS